MISCEQATRLIVERQYRPLPRRQAFSLRLHLLMCLWCRRFLMQMRYLLRGVRRISAVHKQPGFQLSEIARGRMREALRREAGSQGS